MPNVKIQMTNEIQNPNVKKLPTQKLSWVIYLTLNWHLSFEIWNLFPYSLRLITGDLFYLSS